MAVLLATAVGLSTMTYDTRRAMANPAAFAAEFMMWAAIGLLAGYSTDSLLNGAPDIAHMTDEQKADTVDDIHYYFYNKLGYNSADLSSTLSEAAITGYLDATTLGPLANSLKQYFDDAVAAGDLAVVRDYPDFYTALPEFKNVTFTNHIDTTHYYAAIDAMAACKVPARQIVDNWTYVVHSGEWSYIFCQNGNVNINGSANIFPTSFSIRFVDGSYKLVVKSGSSGSVWYVKVHDSTDTALVSNPPCSSSYNPEVITSGLSILSGSDLSITVNTANTDGNSNIGQLVFYSGSSAKPSYTWVSRLEELRNSDGQAIDGFEDKKWTPTPIDLLGVSCHPNTYIGNDVFIGKDGTVSDYGSVNVGNVIEGINEGSIDNYDDVLSKAGAAAGAATGALTGVASDTLVDAKTGEIVSVDDLAKTINLDSSRFKSKQNYIRKFPFSTPFDVIYIVALFDAEPVAPEFDYPMQSLDSNGNVVSYVYHVSLDDFSGAAQAFRNFFFVVVMLFITFATRNMVRG